MEKIGASRKSLAWFESYLSDQKQIVVNGCFTSVTSVSTQGFYTRLSYIFNFYRSD